MITKCVNKQEMIGWDLKSKKAQILLNENPDDGNYNVNSQDSAQVDRMAKVGMRWDAQDWAARAEKIGSDPRTINFVLWQPELLSTKKENGITANGISPRMMDKFFSLVSTIDDFDKHLDKVSLYASITVGNHIGSQFINFINKNLDKLPTIEDLIMNWDLPTAKAALTKVCGDHEKDSANWKSATAGILTTRMFNYARFYNKNFKKDNIKQYLELVLHPAFSVDQKFLMAQKVMTLSNQFSTIMCADPRFMKYMNQ